MLRMPFDDKINIDYFNKIYLPSIIGAQIPLRQVATLDLESNEAQLEHFNTVRSATVTADITDGYNVIAVTQKIKDRIDNEIRFKDGYYVHLGGEYEAQQQSFGQLGLILMISLLGILAVLVLQFRSFIQPLIVLTAIPLAFTGSILALFLTGYTFSFFAFVGFTSLVGIVVNTSIILVDYANQLVRKGTPLLEALEQACVTRFTPILLTALTTICGLLPLTMTQSNLWSPLGWVIIGGMLSSTFLTLFVVPILYKWLTRKSRQHHQQKVPVKTPVPISPEKKKKLKKQ